MIMRLLVSLVLSLTMLSGLSGCASVARTFFPLNEEATLIKPGDYMLDPDHAMVIFSVSHLGFSTFYGRIPVASGRLSLDRDQPARSSVAVRLNAAAIDTGNRVLDESLRAPAMFDAESFPEISFVSTNLVVGEDGRAVLTGDLTLKGISKAVTLDVRFTGSGINPATRNQTVGFSATGKVDRHDFDLNSWSGFVGSEVSLMISAEFYRP